MRFATIVLTLRPGRGRLIFHEENLGKATTAQLAYLAQAPQFFEPENSRQLSTLKQD